MKCILERCAVIHVMLVSRKGDIYGTVSVLKYSVLCTIIMVHNSTSSLYRSDDWV